MNTSHTQLDVTIMHGTQVEMVWAYQEEEQEFTAPAKPRINQVQPCIVKTTRPEYTGTASFN